MRKTRFEQIPVSVVRNIIAAQLAEEEGAMSVRVLIADDSEIVRKSIADFLKDESNIEIVGQASSIAEVLELAAALKPDVVLIDVHMNDGAKGGAPSAALNSSPPAASIVAMSLWNDDETKELATNVGANVLLDKGNLVEELIPTILRSARPNE